MENNISFKRPKRAKSRSYTKGSTNSGKHSQINIKLNRSHSVKSRKLGGSKTKGRNTPILMSRGQTVNYV
jgi:hypothetical protein